MADRRPLHVKCGACGHVWVVLYLPMEMLRAAAVMKGAACPMCGGRKVFLATAADVGAAPKPREVPAL